MDACLETKTDYVDTANYEHPDTAKFEYKYQWEMCIRDSGSVCSVSQQRRASWYTCG